MRGDSLLHLLARELIEISEVWKQRSIERKSVEQFMRQRTYNYQAAFVSLRDKYGLVTNVRNSNGESVSDLLDKIPQDVIELWRESWPDDTAIIFDRIKE